MYQMVVMDDNSLCINKKWKFCVYLW